MDKTEFSSIFGIVVEYYYFVASTYMLSDASYAGAKQIPHIIAYDDDT
jgi:hypothetical protein